MFKHILVILGETAKPDLPVSHAIALAEAFGSRLTVLQLPECSEASGRSKRPTFKYVKASSHHYRQLQMVSNLLQEKAIGGLHVETRNSLESGISFVLRSEADLIVLPDPKNDLKPGILDCGLEILNHCQISTLIVRPRRNPMQGHQNLYERILVPIRLSSSDVTILPYASELAGVFNSHLVFARVLTPPYEDDLIHSEGTQITSLKQRLDETERFLEQRLKPKNVPYNLCIFPGSSLINGIYSLAESENVDLIALRAHGPLSVRDHPQQSLLSHLIANGTRSLLLIQGRRSRPARALKEKAQLKENKS
ncbi:MAG: universal stress protein [Anaerolineales bacterium]|jgi:nucleotide-binding universal stress UspA family protein